MSTLSDDIAVAKHIAKSADSPNDGVVISVTTLTSLINAAELADSLDCPPFSHRQQQLLKAALRELQEAKDFDDKEAARKRSLAGTQSIFFQSNWRIAYALRTLKRLIDGRLKKGTTRNPSKEDDV